MAFAINPATCTIEIANLPPFTLDNNTPYYIKEGRLELLEEPNLDATLYQMNETLILVSKHAYLRIPNNKNESAPFKYYIDLNLHELNINLGCVNLQIEDQSKSNAQCYYVNAMKENIRVVGICKNLKNVLTFSRGNELFQNLLDVSMSLNHCHFGYDVLQGLYYIIDYGKFGQGSSNGTHLKIKDDTRFSIRQNC